MKWAKHWRLLLHAPQTSWALFWFYLNIQFTVELLLSLTASTSQHLTVENPAEMKRPSLKYTFCLTNVLESPGFSNEQVWINAFVNILYVELNLDHSSWTSPSCFSVWDLWHFRSSSAPPLLLISVGLSAAENVLRGSESLRPATVTGSWLGATAEISLDPEWISILSVQMSASPLWAIITVLPITLKKTSFPQKPPAESYALVVFFFVAFKQLSFMFLIHISLFLFSCGSTTWCWRGDEVMMLRIMMLLSLLYLWYMSVFASVVLL